MLNLFPLLVLGLTNFAQFWQFYLQGKLPFPGDLLVSFFYPWFSGGFPGYNSWTTHKEYIASDALRALFPWKVEVMRQVLSGQLPLWNPYNFSGSPLMANLQSSAFFPGNLLYLFLPPLAAWIALVLFLLTIFGCFTYLFLRSQKLSRFSGLIGAIAISNITYLVNWHELLVISQTVLFLPLGLWALERKNLLVLLLSLTFTIFGGHIQTALYVYLIIFLFAIFKGFPKLLLLVCFLLSIGLAAIQIAPSFELYQNSAREGDDSHQIFADHVFPPKNLITILAPDFYGNPVTGNFWSQDYHNSLTYVGIVTLTFALLAIFSIRKQRDKEKRSAVLFFLLLGAIGLLFALPPAVYLFDYFRIPVFSTGVPARTIFLFQFAFGVLGAYGADFWLRQAKKTNLKTFLLPLAILALVYLTVWLFVSLAKGNYLVSRPNLIFPTGVFVAIAFLILISKMIPRLLWLVACVVLLLAIFEHGRYFNKISPFAPVEFAFPPHPVLTYLQQNSGIDRFFGVDKAFVERNFATYYHLFDPDGYDPLYIRRYGQLIASSYNGQVPRFVQRADAVVAPNDSLFRNRLLDILGVKYLLEINDKAKSSWDPDPGKFSPQLYQLVWQQNYWKVYQRLTALPRAFLAGSYEVTTESHIIDRLYDPTFPYKDRLILETDPKFPLDASTTGKIKVDAYFPNLVQLTTSSSGQKLLFLSDAYYPGWEASVDQAPTKIYRADYAFRAIVVPAGVHQVVFRYNPVSVKIGLAISVLSLTASLGLFLWLF